MKELGTLFTILVVGILAWCFLPLLRGEATGQKIAVIVSKNAAVVDYRSLARSDAEQAGIDPALLERQIDEESGFNPRAVSQAGAVGIAQIMPSTARAWGIDPHNPTESLAAAAHAMAYYLHRYGSYAEGLACYNAGCAAMLGAKARCGAYWVSCLPQETQTYIKIIMRL
jgi:soluble lytic murein transglycosylase-like protein